MAIQAQKNSKLVHRSDILDGLKALYITQYRVDPLLKEDSYGYGYKEGFESALFALAQLLGVFDEFQQSPQFLKHLESKRMSLVNGHSS